MASDTDEDDRLQRVLEASREDEENRRQHRLQEEEELSLRERELFLELEMLRQQRERAQAAAEAEAEEQLGRVMEASVREEQQRQERMKRQRDEQLKKMDREFGTRSEQATKVQGGSQVSLSSPMRNERNADPPSRAAYVSSAADTQRNSTPPSRAASTRDSPSAVDGGRSQQQALRNRGQIQSQNQDIPGARPHDRQSTPWAVSRPSRDAERGHEATRAIERDCHLSPLRRTSSSVSTPPSPRLSGSRRQGDLTRQDTGSTDRQITLRNGSLNQPARREYPVRNDPRRTSMDNGPRGNEPRGDEPREFHSLPPERQESLIRNGPIRRSLSTRQNQDPFQLGPNAHPRNGTRRQSSYSRQMDVESSGDNFPSVVGRYSRLHNDALLRTRTIHEVSRNSQASRRPDTSNTQHWRRDYDQILRSHNSSRRSSPRRRNTIQDGTSLSQSHTTMPVEFPGASISPQNQNADDFDVIPEHLPQRSLEDEPRAETDEDFDRLLDELLRASTIEAYNHGGNEDDDTARAIANSLGDPNREAMDPDDQAIVTQGQTPHYTEIWKDQLADPDDRNAKFRLAGLCERDPDHPENEEEICPVPFEFRMVSRKEAADMRQINPGLALYFEDGRAKWDDDYAGISKPKIVTKKEAEEERNRRSSGSLGNSTVSG